MALDANPDRGTLSDRSPGKARHTARQLVQNRFMVDSFTELSTYAAREGSRLDVLASDPDPHVARPSTTLTTGPLRPALQVLLDGLTDSGTGMVHSVIRGRWRRRMRWCGGRTTSTRPGWPPKPCSWLEAHGREAWAARFDRGHRPVPAQRTGRERRRDQGALFRTRAAHVVRLPLQPAPGPEAPAWTCPCCTGPTKHGPRVGPRWRRSLRS